MRRPNLVAAVVLVAGAALAVVVIGTHRPGVARSLGGDATMAAPAAAALARPADDAPVLQRAAQVEFILEYPACGIRKVGTGPVPVGLVGANRAAVAAALRGDTIVGFAPDLLVLNRRLPGCPADTVTLVAREGVVVVLAGPPGDTGGVLHRSAISVRALGTADARRLEAGLAVPAGLAEAELRRLAREAGGTQS